MKISEPLGSPCIGDGPVCVTVTDCDNPESVTWEIKHKPEGAPDPVIFYSGDGVYEITAQIAGSYVIEGECCD